MGNPFCHVELSTDNPGKAREFYAKVFSWSFEDSPSPVPGGTYTHIKVGEGTGGGLMKKAMAEAPNGWLPYVLVDSVDSTMKKAREHGAKIVLEKLTVPGGTFGIFVDPTGATLGVWEVAKK